MNPPHYPEELDRRDMTDARHVNRRRDYLSPNIEPCLEARSSMEEIGRVIARDALATTASDPRRYLIIHRTTARGARTASRVARRMPGSTSGRFSRRAAANGASSNLNRRRAFAGRRLAAAPHPPMHRRSCDSSGVDALRAALTAEPPPAPLETGEIG